MTHKTVEPLLLFNDDIKKKSKTKLKLSCKIY